MDYAIKITPGKVGTSSLLTEFAPTLIRVWSEIRRGTVMVIKWVGGKIRQAAGRSAAQLLTGHT